MIVVEVGKVCHFFTRESTVLHRCLQIHYFHRLSMGKNYRSTSAGRLNGVILTFVRRRWYVLLIPGMRNWIHTNDHFSCRRWSWFLKKHTFNAYLASTSTDLLDFDFLPLLDFGMMEKLDYRPLEFDLVA